MQGRGGDKEIMVDLEERVRRLEFVLDKLAEIYVGLPQDWFTRPTGAPQKMELTDAYANKDGDANVGSKITLPEQFEKLVDLNSDGTVKPKRYLATEWQPINDILKQYGLKWSKPNRRWEP